MSKGLLKGFILCSIFGNIFLSLSGCGAATTAATADYPSVSVKCGTSSCVK